MRLSRRNFLEGSARGQGLSRLGAGRCGSQRLRQSRAQGRILVVLHMRGACDGLNLLCPANDPL